MGTHWHISWKGEKMKNKDGLYVWLLKPHKETEKGVESWRVVCGNCGANVGVSRDAHVYFAYCPWCGAKHEVVKHG